MEKSASVTWQTNQDTCEKAIRCHSTSQNSWFACNSFLHLFTTYYTKYIYIIIYIWYVHMIVHVYTCYTQSTPLAPQNHESSICLTPQIWLQASKNVGFLCPFLIFYSHPSFVASAIVFKEQHFLPLLISPFFARFQSKASCETSWLLNIWQRMTGFADFQHLWVSSVTFNSKVDSILSVSIYEYLMTQWPPTNRNFVLLMCANFHPEISRITTLQERTWTFRSASGPGPLKSLWIWSRRSDDIRLWKTFHD